MSNVTRWDPWNEMLSLREAMSQLMEESVVRPSAARGQGFVPALDVSETEDGYLVEAAVPGLKPEDLEITLENNVLTIKGQTRQESEDKQRSYHRIERRFGSFQRTIGLPTTVKADAIQAKLEHGVLKLDIPKAEEIKPRKIAVSVAAGKTLEASNN
ncbi:MAG TPA: Hsp20/alpha crystallin family protein [Kouleothrix sp.]|uniref:Hsp20/alpha crystallin family protein n=1 Tax=Kouleothrix sp. TaxID=2779161 RepID=UPI002C2655A7|nr:Hsp20/alpha crystallin family protein [Kouleothrix sp.]HRC74876.1 Hsp20/alpha crystallin family protein [Kouleothrix sp.]